MPGQACAFLAALAWIDFVWSLLALAGSILLSLPFLLTEEDKQAADRFGEQAARADGATRSIFDKMRQGIRAGLDRRAATDMTMARIGFFTLIAAFLIALGGRAWLLFGSGCV